MELPYFYVDEMYGFDQSRFYDAWMRLGGCAAVTACDLCIYLALYDGQERLYPYNLTKIKRKEYIRFSNIMKPYLRPRHTGINRLELYLDGFGQYLKAHGGRRLAAGLRGFSGAHSAAEAANALQEQLLRGVPVPCLTLKHADPAYDDYVWHWFLLAGLRRAGEDVESKQALLNGMTGVAVPAEATCHGHDIPAPTGGLEVKLLTYGKWRWVDFDRLWNTGYEQKGGLILLDNCSVWGKDAASEQLSKGAAANAAALAGAAEGSDSASAERLGGRMRL